MVNAAPPPSALDQRPLWHGLDLPRIEAALRAAERQTSAELRVAVSRWYFWGDVRRAAERAFRRLGMPATQRRNGVLLFLSLRRRRFELLGDIAVDEKLTAADWQRVATILRDHFTRGQLSGGIEAAISQLAVELALHFPPVPHDSNELSDAVATDA